MQNSTTKDTFAITHMRAGSNQPVLFFGGNMKKIAIVLLLAFCIAPVSVWAGGYTAVDLEADIIVVDNYLQLSGVPFALGHLHYWFPHATERFGIGASLFSVVMYNALMPSVRVEKDIHTFTIGAAFAGGPFVYFCPTASDGVGFGLFMAQASVGFPISDWFELGTALTLVGGRYGDVEDTMDGEMILGFSVYTRFSFQPFS
jgi:hypothetical protein